LALQGGGSHGAFTWGVLDRLLEEDDLDIVGISGTSAGACNAVLVAEGILEGGKPKAREQLEDFWLHVAKAGETSPLRRSPVDRMRGVYSLDSSPMHLWIDMMSRLFSPYQLDPQGRNPLRPLLEKYVDFARVRASRDVKVFINATNVKTGTLRVFREHEASVETVLASACLPTMFHAVEIEGESYWDGGYIANPALFPMLDATGVQDILIVQINPLRVDKAPTEARDIINRLGEIQFNSTLIKEIRMIAMKNDLIESGDLDPAKHPLVHLHMIHGHQELVRFESSSKFLTEWQFLKTLRDIGRRFADSWLADAREMIGRRSSLDYHALILGR
jgi:NTE family protein